MNQNINHSPDEMDTSEIMIGLVFPTEEAAVEAIDTWSVKAMCTLSKIRYKKGVEKNGQYIKGRRNYQCPHGVICKSKATGARAYQRLKYTKCHVKVNLTEQDGGSWMITSCVLDHSRHPVTEQNFLRKSNKSTCIPNISSWRYQGCRWRRYA